MEDKPLIAVVDAWGSVLKGLRDAGADPIDCGYDVKPEQVDRLVEAVDAVVFTGGGDVSPKHYRQPALRTTSIAGLDRDRGELMIARAARRAGIPMMGICRGHQLLNVAFGGTLHQHLPLHGSGRINHGYSEHRVKFALHSMIGDALKRHSPQVTSLHHQGVDRLGDGLIAVGWALDGTVEAIESTDSPYVLGVQFHPEMDLDIAPWAYKVFDHFVRRVQLGRTPNERDYWERRAAIPQDSYSGSYNMGHGYSGVLWDDDWDGYVWDVKRNRWQNERSDEEGATDRDWKKDALAITDKVLQRRHTEMIADARAAFLDNLTHDEGEFRRSQEAVKAVDEYDPTIEDAFNMTCAFPPCEMKDSCTPEYGGCFREWRAMHGGDD